MRNSEGERKFFHRGHREKNAASSVGNLPGICQSKKCTAIFQTQRHNVSGRLQKQAVLLTVLVQNSRCAIAADQFFPYPEKKSGAVRF